MRGRVRLRCSRWAGSASCAQRGLAEVFAAADADLAVAAGGAALAERAGLAIVGVKRATRAPSARGAAGPGLVDRRRLALRAGDVSAVEVDRRTRPCAIVSVVGRCRCCAAARAPRSRVARVARGLRCCRRRCRRAPAAGAARGLLLDQRGGVVAVVLVAGRDRDRGHHRRLRVGRDVQLVAGEAARVGLAAVAHLGVVRGDDLPRPAAVPRPRPSLVVVGARTPGRRSRATAARPRRPPRQRRAPGRARRPAARAGRRWRPRPASLRGRLVVPVRRPASRAGARSRTPTPRAAARPRRASSARDGVDQLAHRGADQRDRVLDRRRAEHRRGVDDLLDRALQQPELGGQLERALEHDPFLAVQQQPRAELDQARRVKPGMIDRQIQRDLPAQIKPQRLHRAPVREPVAIGQQQHLGQQARRDRRAPPARRIALGEVLVADDPIAVLGQQRVDRALRPTAPRTTPRQRTPADVRSRQASTTLRNRRFTAKSTVQTGRIPRRHAPTFSAVSDEFAPLGRAPLPPGAG